jgi:hypothetical protein
MRHEGKGNQKRKYGRKSESSMGHHHINSLWVSRKVRTMSGKSLEGLWDKGEQYKIARICKVCNEVIPDTKELIRRYGVYAADNFNAFGVCSPQCFTKVKLALLGGEFKKA